VSDLKVDYQLLDSTERNLSSLVSEFQNMQAQEDAYSGAMGSGDIASAMNGFATNWKDHKKSLISSMQTLGKMVSETKQQFQKADTKLTKSLTQKPR
jgi:2C-methyl-D-erythritol 2,4-cyclodiphosphate synthase